MKEENIALAVALRDLDCFSLNTLSDRLLVQKKIYLSQALGVDFGYRYNWYLRGPYSPELASAAFDVIPYGVDYIKEYEFGSEVRSVFNKVNKMSDSEGRKNSNMAIADWYELLASIHYLLNNITGQSKVDVCNKLITEKPKYTKEDFNAAWEELKQNGLISGREC